MEPLMTIGPLTLSLVEISLYSVRTYADAEPWPLHHRHQHHRIATDPTSHRRLRLFPSLPDYDQSRPSSTSFL